MWAKYIVYYNNSCHRYIYNADIDKLTFSVSLSYLFDSRIMITWKSDPIYYTKIVNYDKFSTSAEVKDKYRKSTFPAAWSQTYEFLSAYSILQSTKFRNRQ